LKVARFLGFRLGEENGKPKLYFLTKCPYCGGISKTPYPFRFNLCDCGKISEVKREDTSLMVKIQDRFEELRFEYNHSLPHIKAQLREEFGNLVRVKEASCFD